MPLYKVTYAFERSGGNIEYQTTQQVHTEADTHSSDVALVTTGLSLETKSTDGSALIEAAGDLNPVDVFESAKAIQQVSPPDETNTPPGADQESVTVPVADDAISAFKEDEELTDVVGDVRETPGHGFCLQSDLTRWHPHKQDLWLVPLTTVEVRTDTALSKTTIVEFYRENFDRFEEEPALKIGAYHGTADETLRLSLLAPVATQQEAEELAGQADSTGVMNSYRFELAKESLVVGTATHGPGQITAVFRSQSGDEVCSQGLAHRALYEEIDAAFTPLGVLVDGDLYRPVTVDADDAGLKSIGDPLHVETYRGADGKPWQFGVAQHAGELLITQARGPPAKFDPVLKRFPIETQTIGDEPLVFSHTVSRRVWSEDPLNIHVQSQRSEGLRTQFLYADSDGWHLIQPESLGEPADSPESAFEETTLTGVSVRSSLLRAETDGETKATVEHEYRITEDVFTVSERLYALSYHEVNEESIERLLWRFADATAYEIVPKKHDA